jgi:PhnB protein
VVTSIAPWLSVRNAAEALSFYQAAFGAVELERLEDEAGDVVVAQLSIDGADFWIQTDAASSPDALNGRSVRMILSVADPDSVFESAVAAGATEVVPVSEGYGWRVGRIADPFGHHWEIGRRLVT